MLIHTFLENSAALYPDKVAIIHDPERATYREINNQANSLARWLQECKVARGDRVALLLENSIDYVTSYYAVLKAGCVAAPLNPGLKPEGLQYLLDDLEPSAIVTNYKTERLLKAVHLRDTALRALIIRNPKMKWAESPFPVLTFEESIIQQSNSSNNLGKAIDPSEPASIIYTSGSTGKPKGVMLSHANIVSNTLSIGQYLSLAPSDIQMVVLPFFYVMGKSLLNTHVAAGGTLVINNRFLYPADVVKQMIDEHVTGFSGVPSTYAYLLNRSPLAACREKLSSLRYCSQAGGHMAAALKRNVRKALPYHTRFYIMYGATEASARLTYLDPEFFESKMDSIGKPVAGVTIRIMDDQNRELPDSREGELVASGPNIMMGYWKDPQETCRVLDSNGYHTGDMGYRDAEGFLFISNRKDGLVKVGGHRINPVEIEDFLMGTDLLVESVLVPLPDPLLGNKLVALVVPKEEITGVQNLMQICSAGLPHHKIPADVIITRALPKNANAKIDLNKCLEIVQRKQNGKKKAS